MHDSKDAMLQAHSMQFLEMAFRVDRQERLAHADGYGKQSRDCGDTIEFYLVIDNEQIKTVSYILHGCINTNACANAIITMIEGQSVVSAWKLTAEAVSAYLESLPSHHLHSAELAIDALRRALADARDKCKSPWKKLYG